MTSTESRRVLIPVDGSEHSERAVKFYMNQMLKEKDQVFLYHSIDRSDIILTLAGTDPLLYTEDDLKTAVAKKNEEVKELKDKFQKLLGEKITSEFLTSTHVSGVGPAMLEMSKEKNVDFIIIGNRGLGTFRRTFLGSNSDYLVHHSNIPVTIVPPIISSD